MKPLPGDRIRAAARDWLAKYNRLTDFLDDPKPADGYIEEELDQAVWEEIDAEERLIALLRVRALPFAFTLDGFVVTLYIHDDERGEPLSRASDPAPLHLTAVPLEAILNLEDPCEPAGALGGFAKGRQDRQGALEDALEQARA